MSAEIAGASFFSEFTGTTPTVPTKRDTLSYQDSLNELERFADKEPGTLKHEPTYKPTANALSKFYSVIDLHWSQGGQSLMFTVFRPKCGNSPQAKIHLAIPAYKLAELGVGIPGEWKWLNDALNDEVLDMDKLDDMPDPFADEPYIES